MPPELIALFGNNALSPASLGGFFQLEYLGIMWILIAGSAVILYAIKSIASEAGAGTLELLMSQPLGRLTFVLTRVVGLVVYAAVIVAASFAPIMVFGPGYDIDLPVETYALLCGLGMLFALAIGGLAFMLSAFSRDGGRPAGIMGGLLGAMWIGDFLSQVSDVAEWFKPVNLVTYWQPGFIINDGALPTPDAWWVFSAVAVISLAVGVVAFLRRDIA
jgi:ABC-2 type transport system permease protein